MVLHAGSWICCIMRGIATCWLLFRVHCYYEANIIMSHPPRLIGGGMKYGIWTRQLPLQGQSLSSNQVYTSEHMCSKTIRQIPLSKGMLLESNLLHNPYPPPSYLLQNVKRKAQTYNWNRMLCPTNKSFSVNVILQLQQNLELKLCSNSGLQSSSAVLAT